MASGSAESATLSLKDSDNNNDTLLGDKNTNKSTSANTSNSNSAPSGTKNINGNNSAPTNASKTKSTKSKGKNTNSQNNNSSSTKLSKPEPKEVKESNLPAPTVTKVETNGSTAPVEEEERKVNGTTNQNDDQSSNCNGNTTNNSNGNSLGDIEFESNNGKHLSSLKDIHLNNNHSSSNEVTSSQAPIELVRYSDPIREEIIIDTNQLQERYKFFEEYSEAQATAAKAKRLQSTPPREIIRRRKESGPEIVESEPANLDPSVVRSSDVVDDRPRTDTAKKMLNVFKQLEAAAASNGSGISGSTNGRQVTSPIGGASGIPPKPLKRITPPRELDTPNRLHVPDSSNEVVHSDEPMDTSTATNGTSGPSSIDGIVTGSTAAVISAFTNAASGVSNASNNASNSRPAIPEDLTNVLPPEMTRSLKEKFENWNGNTNNNNNNNYPSSASLKNGIEKGGPALSNSLLTNRINGYLNGSASNGTESVTDGDATSTDASDSKSQLDSEFGQTGVKKCDTVKNLKAKFEQIKDEPSKTSSERRIRRVSSFVVSI